MTYGGIERRSAFRLRDGDRRQCPQCRGTLEFRERYLVLSDGQRALPAAQPAWICLTIGCGYREFVRKNDTEQRDPAASDRRTVTRGGRRTSDPPAADSPPAEHSPKRTS